MPWSGDTQAYLDSLYQKRATLIGVRGNAFSDQQTTWDLESLDREIARVEGVLARKAGRSSTRYAATSKGC